MTRKITYYMECMDLEFYSILTSHTYFFNMDYIDLSKTPNRCFITMYYSWDTSKESYLLDYHSDYMYSPINSEFVISDSSYVKNTSAVIYSLDDTLKLNWRRKNWKYLTYGVLYWLKMILLVHHLRWALLQ